MSNNKKKRLSLYDFFGKSSESPSSKTTSKKHQRSSSDTSKSYSTSKEKTSHRLTFQLPDESIVSNIDMSQIPIPNRQSIDVKRKYAGLQNNTNTSPVNKVSYANNKLTTSTVKNLNNINKDNTKSLKPESDTSGKSIDTITSPIADPNSPPPPRPLNDYKSSNGPYGRIHSGSSQSKGNRLVSNTSLSSSVYPNDPMSPIISNRNGSNSTLPDFSRQASSIYPPSSYNYEISNNQSQELKISSTIKRSDLLKKRKPPPLALKVNTQPIITPTTVNNNINDPKSATDTIKVSASELSAASTESGYTPLNIIPYMKTQDPLKSAILEKQSSVEKPSSFESRRPTEYSSTDSDFSVLQLMPINKNIKDNPLAPEKQINPYNTEEDDYKYDDYKPPNFHSNYYANDNNNNNNTQNANSNIHKHSRTLSSIEEITSALENFQIEHERSFNKTGDVDSFSGNDDTGEHTDDVTGNTFSFNKSLNNDNILGSHIYKNLSQDFEKNHHAQTTDENIKSNNFNGDDELIVRVKDLPQLETGETLDHYISKLKTKVKNNSIDSTNSIDSNILVQPAKFINHKSEASSGSEIFYDAVDISNNQNSENDKSTSTKLETLPHDLGNSSDEELSIIRVVGDISEDDNGEEEDFLGDNINQDANDSFDSYVKKVVSQATSKDDKDLSSGAEKFSETQTISTETSNIPRDVVTEDGVWQRYSSATNFFNNADQLDDGQIIDDNESGNIVHRDDSRNKNDENNSNNANEQSILTPTENPEFVNMNGNFNNTNKNNPITLHRDFDLGDELDNNVTTIESDNDSNKSFEDLYPTHSDDEDFTDDDDSSAADDDTDNIEQGNYHYEGNYRYGSDSEEGNDNVEYSPDGKKFEDSVNDSTTDNNHSRYNDSVLEFSPRSQRSLDSIEDMAKTPDIFRHNSMTSRGVLEKMSGINVNGTPTGLGIGTREHLVVINQELDPLAETDFQDSIDDGFDEVIDAPIPDIESSGSSRLGERGSSDEEIDSVRDNIEPLKETPQNIYDRREDPTVMPIQHSMVITPAAPITGISPSAKTRRPPPDYASTGRRGRGLSETTANPEMFVNGITQQLKVSNNVTDTAGNNSENDIVKKEVRYQNDDIDDNSTSENLTRNDIESRKGEKCTYVENLRLRGKKTTVNTKPSLQVLPIAIRQNGTISHKKIPSQQLFHSFKSHKHVTAKPKTRMLASEIDNSELPDATMIHRGQKTKVPIHPDADVIAASEQFNKLAKRQSSTGDLGRYNSVLSVRPHYGNGMRLFITNPDSDEE